jgi:hypothetical protein
MGSAIVHSLHPCWGSRCILDSPVQYYPRPFFGFPWISLFLSVNDLVAVSYLFLTLSHSSLARGHAQ